MAVNEVSLAQPAAPGMQYCIALDANGGEVSPAEILVSAGDTYALPTPTRFGYQFAGWYLDETLIASGDPVAVGSSFALSVEIMNADITSLSAFNDSANWKTVGYIFSGGLLGSAYGFSLSQANELLNTKKIAHRIANAERTGTALAKNDIYHRANVIKLRKAGLHRKVRSSFL